MQYLRYYYKQIVEFVVGEKFVFRVLFPLTLSWIYLGVCQNSYHQKMHLLLII
jgi:hypothetical protein